MAFSRITFYRMPEMSKDKNFIIEDFDSYLNALTKTSSIKVQYIKPEFETNIKLNSQSVGSLIQNSLNYPQTTSYDLSYYNYLKVEYYIEDEGDEELTGQKKIYYFVNSWNWKASNTAEISITMDVLNLIGVPSNSNSYCKWDAKTRIIREHQNRFKLNASNQPVWNIDKKTEGIATYQYKTGDHIVLENALIERKWYFIYMNALTTPDDPDNYVELFICAEDDIKIGVDTIKNIDAWNRTDSRIIRIIEWPYCPIPDTIVKWDDDNEYIAIEPGYSTYFQVVSVEGFGKMLKVKDHSLVLGNEFSPYLDDATLDRLNPFYYHPISDMIDDFGDNSKVNRSKFYEPKLYHSDFYSVKYLYDAIAKYLKFEEFDFARTYAFKIKFIPSNSASTKMAFKIDASQWINGKEDFYNYLLSNRNNNITLFNVAYYNYLRTTDTWNNFKQNQQTAKSAFNMLGKMLSNPTEMIGSLVNGISGMIFDKVNAEASVEETKQALRWQETAVNGSDDLSLFNEYSGNKLHKITYNVSDETQQLLFDLFYYTGYIQNKMGVPDTSSRYWFNFVQCEPVFKNMLLNLTPGVWEAYKNKWREGITIFHHHTDGWNIEQTAENIEVALL